MIRASDVKELRERTGSGMMDCKKALTEAGGDLEKAIELLREKGLATAAKKSGRIAAEGLVDAVVEGGVGAVVEINSETDFVAKNSDFQKFVADVAALVAKENPKDVEALLELSFAPLPGRTVREALNEKISVIGENLNIRRFERYEGIVEAYVHGGGRIGVLAQYKLSDEAKASEPAFTEFAHDITMQIAATSPLYVSGDSVPPEVIEKEREILMAQAIAEGKPENIAEKIVMGRISKYKKEICLNDQPFVKDPDMTVSALIKEIEKAVGSEIQILRFVRFEKGEGIKKREDDFADEVSKMVK